MGQTRNFLGDLQGIMTQHRQIKRELITKYCKNPNLEKYYRNQIEVFDQKYEKQFREMIQSHIDYLEAKDPYGRTPLWGAEVKKQLFIKLRQDLEPLQGEAFIRKLSRSVTDLQQNELIDQPRWPNLKLDNMFHLFKSILSNKTGYSDNANKPEHQSKTPK